MFSDVKTAAESTMAAAGTSDNQKNKDREPIQVMLVGSNEGIDNIIKGLHSLGFAEVGDWSRPQPYPNSGRSMSILTKWRQL